MYSFNGIRQTFKIGNCFEVRWQGLYVDNLARYFAIEIIEFETLYNFNSINIFLIKLALGSCYA